MDEVARLRDALVGWAARGDGDPRAARELAEATGVRALVLVEGVSDRAAVEELAARRGRDLVSEGVCVVPLGGATSIGRFLQVLGSSGLALVGLCDAGERAYVVRAWEQAGLDSAQVHVCDADLEHELIRALGVAGVERVVDEQGDLRALRVFQHQPAQRLQTAEHQLHRFMGTLRGRKERYARALVDALELDRVPQPLDDVLAGV